jgi:uncharacterized protein YcfJ
VAESSAVIVAIGISVGAAVGAGAGAAVGASVGDGRGVQVGARVAGAVGDWVVGVPQAAQANSNTLAKMKRRRFMACFRQI